MLVVVDDNAIWRRKPFEAMSRLLSVAGLYPRVSHYCLAYRAMAFPRTCRSATIAFLLSCTYLIAAWLGIEACTQIATRNLENH